MLIPFPTALKERYGDYIQKWWMGRELHLKNWVHELRDDYIIGGLMFKPFHFVFNGAGFKNELNTKWEDGWKILNVILYAPVLRREILPSEIVIDLDIENREELIRKVKWVKSALEVYEIDYTMGFSGNRGFHFHVIIDPSTKLPAELPEGFTLNIFKEAIFNLIGYCAGFDGVDIETAGFKAKRHAIREFFSINHKNMGYKIPVEDIEVNLIKFPNPVEIYGWDGYQLWTPSSSQLSEILEEVERILVERKRSQKRLENIWRAKPRKKRTIGSRWRFERIQRYAEALRKYGRLTADPEIAQIHESEHKARVHLACLMIEEGWSDEEILEVFSFANNFNKKETLRQIRSCRKTVAKSKQTPAQA